MKKLLLFLPIFIFCFSCESDQDWAVPTAAETVSRPGPVVSQADPNKLTKVILWPGTTSEKRLYFFPNGLLKSVANRFNVVYQKYLYDSNNNLTNIISSTPSTFTYDSNNNITSYNGMPVVYDAAANKYVFTYVPSNDYDWADRREISLNSERLLMHDITYYTIFEQNQYFYYWNESLQAGYEANNMLYVNHPSDPSGDSHTFDNKVNPLKAALLPVTRANSVGNHDFVAGMYCSSNNVITNGYSIKDPESEEFVITYNANNLPASTVVKNYYNGTLESTRLYARYYYQTNTLP